LDLGKKAVVKPKRSVWRIIGWTLYFGIYAVVGFTFGMTKVLMEDLPPVTALEDYAPSLPTELYDCKGRLITNYYIERRYIVPLEQIPEALRDGVIATEDEYFYQHFGINPLAFVRAVLVNVRAGGARRQGGSTLTMQLARNLFLTPDKTLVRKIKEIILALQIEQSYSKDEIL
jgi:penicillin-binding protein 1A